MRPTVIDILHFWYVELARLERRQDWALKHGYYRIAVACEDRAESCWQAILTLEQESR